MSREERRSRERQMRSMERGPSLPPAARARADRNAARRAARKAVPPTYGFTRRFLIGATIVAVAIGFAAFSFVWPNMPFALYLGLVVTGITLAIQVGIRILRRRASTR